MPGNILRDLPSTSTQRAGTLPAANMLKAYIVYYRFQTPEDKKPGPVRQYRLYANNFEEARRLVTEHGNYPKLEILDIKAA